MNLFKNLLLLAVLSLWFSCSAQEGKTVIIDRILAPMVVEFVTEAEKRGIDVKERLISLDSIVFTKDMRVLGIWTDNKVKVNYFMQMDDFAMKVVLYHELFHSLGVKHCHQSCLHLMGAGKPSGFTFSLYFNEEVWGRVLDREFNKIL